ncbi:hypothetical protein BDW42DRAFT_201286 [Aspergillus taichungensis]|uniref:Peptidase M12A domain-containing protein n=1 Tax=Aspergillus taichungensis TaxID=482145 RepID=A0A2J5HTA7_9EURO|nr:hypothetical protein BDW42DRAFT_201286 [Aspergillus taichungensis]
MAARMLWKIAFLLLLALSLSCVVDAGSATWETARPKGGKWVGQDHIEEDMRWPERTVRYAYSDPSSRDDLNTWVRIGLDLWYANGLPESFKMVEVDRRECRRDGNNCLTITRSFKELSTPIGKQIPQSFHTLMAQWTTDSSIGMLEPGANIAHEIGHVFGLYHESHNPSFWKTGGNPWDNFELYCENFEGFEGLSDRFSFGMIWGARGLCKDGCVARRFKFRAAEVLPCKDDNALTPISGITTDADVDWSSIMMTPSYIGTGRDPREDDDRPTLRRALGKRYIRPNYAPTPSDVEGLKTLYEAPYMAPRPRLHNDPRSPAYGLFQRSAPGCS